MASQAKVVISLVTWNGEKYLPSLKQSLDNQTFNDYKIIIIDNGSTDNTVSEISKNFSEVNLIKEKKNLGFARSHNLIIGQTGNDYILVLNQDIVLESGYLERLVNFLDQHPRVAAASGKLLRLKDGQKTSTIDSLGHKIYKSQQVVEISTGQKDNLPANYLEEIFSLPATATLYRRQALEEIKVDGQYFDEDFFSYKEDVDLGYRLRLAGWQTWLIGGVVAFHDRSAKGVNAGISLTVAKNRYLRSDYIKFHSYNNHLFVLIKNLTWYNLFWCFPYILSYELIKFFYLLFFETRTLSSAPLIFKNFGKMIKKRKVIMSNKKISNQELFKWFK